MNKGFTLVELLVVVAIIAILSTIGLTLFSGAQANARDARRKSDVDAIAAALESNRAPGTVYYSALPTSAFSGGSIPTDTYTGATGSRYCIKTYSADDGAKNETFVASGVGAWVWANSTVCPTAPAAAVVATGYGFLEAVTGGDKGFDTSTGKEFPVSTVKSWKICARLETSDASRATLQVYCKNSAQ